MEARKVKNTALVLTQLLGRAVHCFSQNGRAGGALGLSYPIPAEAEKSLQALRPAWLVLYVELYVSEFQARRSETTTQNNGMK